MKRRVFLVLCLIFVILTGCTGTPSEVLVPPEIENEQKLPSKFSLDSLEISAEEIIETIQVDFHDGDTKVKLTNSDGKYLVVNYKIKNNESFDIDIDHSVEIAVADVYGNFHYGEYYEYKTGKENIKVGPNEEKMVSFVCDLEIEEKPDVLIFKYKGNEKKIEVE